MKESDPSNWQAEPAPIRSEVLEGLVGYRLRRAATVFMTDFRLAMGDSSIRPVLFAMLSIVAENPGINQTSLGRALGIQRANLVPLVNDLLERKLIERRPAQQDKRAFALFLSSKGQAELIEATKRIRAQEQRRLKPLDKKERAQLLELLRRISGE